MCQITVVSPQELLLHYRYRILRILNFIITNIVVRSSEISCCVWIEFRRLFFPQHFVFLFAGNQKTDCHVQMVALTKIQINHQAQNAFLNFIPTRLVDGCRKKLVQTDAGKNGTSLKKKILRGPREANSHF